MATIKLEPGSLGIKSSDWNFGRVSNVAEGSQGALAGVKVGWYIRKINGQDYTEALLDSCVGGTKPFTIVFEKAKDEVQVLSADELTLNEKVGFGCTAEVFRGEFRGHNVAIKRILAQRSSMSKDRQVEFEREVSVLAKIDQENLVGLFGICFQGSLNIITEFCGGGTLFDLLYNTENMKLHWLQKLKICNGVANGMDYLHNFDPQIIHRDLKSLNLLLVRAVRSAADVPLVKISDFGMARMRDMNTTWGQMTKEVGTLHWMAPEILGGCHYNERVDIYSFSMVLYEVACEIPPFDDVEPPSQVKSLVLKEHRPQLRHVLPDCPEGFVELMTVCWAHDPLTRPTFRAILRVLGTITAGCSEVPASKAAGVPRSAAGYVSKSVARGPYQSISL
mmetsp:Transcript_90817/g.257257  ORF Transcript_90817/g.257257 Transcript_90817/m.257257 type:complete len:392 (-) Transcript_90817:74-1249(-)